MSLSDLVFLDIMLSGHSSKPQGVEESGGAAGLCFMTFMVGLVAIWFFSLFMCWVSDKLDDALDAKIRERKRRKPANKEWPWNA